MHTLEGVTRYESGGKHDAQLSTDIRDDLLSWSP